MKANYCTVRFILFIWFSIWPALVESLSLTVATYNLWNVMFNWNIRLRLMADVIKEHDLDIVVFQEVQMSKCDPSTGSTGLTTCKSQLDEFRWQLPEYKWISAFPAGKVSRVKGSFNDEWEFEGLGILSRKEVVSSEVISLRQTSFQDQNKRIALHVRLRLGPAHSDIWDIIVVHFSYNSNQQCDNAKDVIELIERNADLKRAIILGDFNVYHKESPAVDRFVGSQDGRPTCPDLDEHDLKVAGSFKDAWLLAGETHVEGLTFSNMPTPGPQSRPDRILVGRDVRVERVIVARNESDYWTHYHRAATYNRAWTVLVATYHSFVGHQGYSCLHDCGPHGSCRCGVCVKGGDQYNCHLPDCSECNEGKFVIFVLFSCTILAISFVFLLAVIRILVVSARFSQNDVMDILGYRCCLFNRRLYRFPVLSRKIKIRVLNILKLYNLPPAPVAVIALIMLTLVFLVMLTLFGRTWQVITSILPEETFPSDHKMVLAKLYL